MSRPTGTRWRPAHTGLVGALATLVGAGTALQEVPGLFPEGAGVWVALSGLLGTAAAVTGQTLLERADHARAPEPDPMSRPRLRPRLPPPTDHFTGRDELMSELPALFDRFPRPGARSLVDRFPRPGRGNDSRGPLVIAITGEGGTGKSELAVQIADRVADRFPDGKMEFELYGAAPQGPAGGRSPRAPEEVLAEMVKEMGRHPTEDASLEELKGMWRTATEERRLLLVLDNAKDHKQVEPLLPGGRGCAVLVTGRTTFAGADRSMVQRPLDTLSDKEGLELIERLVSASGRALTEEDRAALPGLVEACHGLPLAIRQVGTQITRSNSTSAAELLTDMRESRLLPGLSSSLAFGLQQCEPGERLLLGRLAGAGLTTFTAWAAAALVDSDEEEAMGMLENLSDRYLLTYLYRSAGFRRFQLHDRVRATLRGEGPNLLGIPEEERPDWSAERLKIAERRLLAAYARRAEAAARRAAPHEWNVGVAPADPSEPADRSRMVPAPDDPLAWLESERRGFEVCFQKTRPGRTGEPVDPRLIVHGQRLRRAFAVLCRTGRRHWSAMRVATQEATVLALESQDPSAYGVALLDRAEVAGGHGDHDTGYERALTALHVLEGVEPAVDPRRLARAHRAIGVNLYRRGDLDDGRDELEVARRIFEEHDDPWWTARTLCNLAEVDRFQGHLERAYDLLFQAEALIAGSRDLPELSSRVQLQRGEVLRLRGFTLNAWFVLSDGLEQLSRASNEYWYRARFLRSLGQLSTRDLNREAGECELLFAPWRARDRRSQARDPRWRALQETKVRALFVEGYPEYAERCARPGPSRWSLGRAGRLRDTWKVERQVERLREAERTFEEIGDDWGRWRTCLVLGEALLDHGGGDGKEEFLRAARGFEELGDKWWHARAHRRAAESLRRAGRLAEAEELARVAIEGYRGLRHRSGRLRATILLAEILAVPNPVAAWRILDQARAIAEEGVLSGDVPESLLREMERLSHRTRALKEAIESSRPS
ncbi:NB-ARC domain-containing protein [Nocardiopsis sp. NPDC055879]